MINFCFLLEGPFGDVGGIVDIGVDGIVAEAGVRRTENGCLRLLRRSGVFLWVKISSVIPLHHHRRYILDSKTLAFCAIKDSKVLLWKLNNLRRGTSYQF